ncbi:MAG: homoserine dehydrogenase [Thermus sp.]|uniref:homoserine dehydrogenase n=1 Tax=Thermus sp. TaxID=275 RepID=UPI003317591A
MKAFRIALLGGGTVGGSFYALVQGQKERFLSLGLEVGFTGVLVRDPEKPRAIPRALLKGEPFDLLEAEVVVEAMGGVEAPFRLLLPALEAGIPVITANKALLAERWEALRPFAAKGLLYYEASVMAGTPSLAALEALRGARPLELHALLNGTTLYLLDEMEKGKPYEEALKEAQAKGYAEADPSLDVLGTDAAHKLTLLARLLVDPQFPFSEVRTKGITHLTPEALKEARRRGLRIRLVGSLFPQGGRWRAEVRPVALPLDHPLAETQGQNALLFLSRELGEVFLRGPGAGGEATAAGLLSDLFRLLLGTPGHKPLPHPIPAPDHTPVRWEEA